MPNDRIPAILLFGPPGVGKGTQSRFLAERQELFHSSTGEIFRSLDPESSEGREAHEFSSRGELVPDELTIRIWWNWLSAAISSGDFDPDSQVLVLDGIPRSIQQCRFLDRDLDVRIILHLKAEDEEAIIARIQKRAQEEGRTDDADPRIIRRRFQVYASQTQPVLGFYPHEKVRTINPMGSPSEVSGRVLQEIQPLLAERAC